MARIDVGFALHNVQSRTPYPILPQRFRKGIRINHSPARRIHKRRRLLTLAQKRLINQMIRLFTTGRQYDDQIADAG